MRLIDDRIRIEQVRLLYSSTPLAITAIFVAIAAISFILHAQIPHGILYGWGFYMFCIAVTRFVIYRRFLQDSECYHCSMWIRIFVATSFLTGSGWGAAVMLFLPLLDQVYQLLLLLTIVAYLAGAMTTLFPSKVALFMMYITILLPVLYRSFGSGGEINLSLALLLAIFTAFVISGARRLNALLRNSLKLRFENEALAENLQIEMEEGEKLNRSLADEIESRKQTEQQLVHARVDAESASQAKDRFLANMSHEIRTPMNTILGMSRLALQNVVDAKQRNYIEKVNHSAESLLGIINDILDFSKIEADRLELEETEFRLEEVFDNLSSLVGQKAEEKGLALRYDLLPEVPAALIGDPLRLSQVLINLGNNAVKFTDRGEIVISVHLQARDERGVRLQFTVRDTGIGLTPKQQETLFNPFSQADASTTRKYGGTGLGLAICRRLVEMMGGEIRVESKPGRGSTFSFTVTLQQAQPASAGPVQPPVSQHAAYQRAIRALRGAHLLLVEDNEFNRELTILLLTEQGLSVEVASNGREALDMLAYNQYDGVLMDCQMPVMDGYTATEEIRRQPRQRDLPIIAMTANAMVGDREEALAAGMNDHIAKPIDVREMFNTLARWIKPLRDVPGTGTGKDAGGGTEATEPEKHINRALALARMGGRVALYQDLLKMFEHKQAGAVASIRAALVNGDRELAVEVAHILKGSSGSIGAEQLQAQVAALEQSLKESGTVTEAELQLLEAELIGVLDELGGVEGGGVENDPSTGPELN